MCSGKLRGTMPYNVAWRPSGKGTLGAAGLGREGREEDIISINEV